MADAGLPSFAVLIANWNGEAFLERCVGSVLAALRHAGAPTEILVVDDASDDRSPELIATQFPTVRQLRLKRNVGYAQAVNQGMAALKADWVFLLNNDLALQVDFCASLIRALRDHNPERVFAIGARTLDWETHALNHGGQQAVWREGLVRQESFDAETLQPTVFFQAGACLVHRAKFESMGGFADLYRPGYWEDYDLAYQALRRGWNNFYEPRATAYHMGKGSMQRRYGRWGVSLLTRRNHLLFIWSNLTDQRLVICHLLGLGLLALREPVLAGEAGWGRALFSALGRLPATLMVRWRRRSIPGIADRQILLSACPRTTRSPET